MVFPVVTYGCESWTIKKAERRWIDAFELWCWRRLFRVLDSKEIQPVNPKGNQSWIFTGRSDAEAEAPVPLATWCEEPTHWKRPWCWERLRAGREGRDRGWDGGMASPTQWTWVWASFRRWWRTGKPGMLQFMELQRVRHNWGTEQQHCKFMYMTECVALHLTCILWEDCTGEDSRMNVDKRTTFDCVNLISVLTILQGRHSYSLYIVRGLSFRKFMQLSWGFTTNKSGLEGRILSIC